MVASAIFSDKTKLYLICDGETCETRDLRREDFVAAAVAAGAGIIQYRHKNISETEYAENFDKLAACCRGTQTTLIVNDHAAVAQKYALPLHLGQGDALPRGLTVPYGRSTHNLPELDLALSAKPQPVYIALGTMFSSGTKPGIIPARELINTYRDKTALPLVLIGGITLDNVSLLLQSEKIFYAVIGDAFRFGATKDGIGKYVQAWNLSFSGG
jgi:thiamine-phosphate pyrophosphorylase